MASTPYEPPRISKIASCTEQAFGASCTVGNWFRVRECTLGMNAETACSYGFQAQGLGCEDGYQPSQGSWCIRGPSFRRS